MRSPINLEALIKKGAIHMKRYFGFFIMLLLIACNNANPKAQSTTSVQTPLTHSHVSTTQTPRQTAKPNKTAYISTPLLTQTPDEILNSAVQRQCLDIDTIDTDIVSFPDIAETGIVVLRDTTSYSTYILDIETNTRYSLPLESQHNLFIPSMHISPNGDYLAYIESIENDSGYVGRIIRVVDSEGVVLANQLINFDILFREWRWLDNERIEFNVQSITTKDGTVAIYYPFKDEWQYLSNTLPDFYQYFDFVLSPTSWLVEYSANLEQAIYLGIIDESVGPILWDVNLDKVIWQTSAPNALTRVPRWSISGDKVAIPQDDNLYIIDIDGKITVTPDLGQDYAIMRITWAPDGNHIALLVRYSQPEIEHYIMLYDVKNNQVIDYCIESGNLLSVRSPLWSNNSRFLFSYLGTTADKKLQNSPILIDTKKNSVYLLSNELIPLAWMNSKSK